MCIVDRSALLPHKQVAGSMLSGSLFTSKLQVTAVPKCILSRGPCGFGWAADGAYVNGVATLAACVVAYAAVEVGPVPAALGEWATSLARIGVRHINFGSVGARLVGIWKDTMVNWRSNVRLHPVMMAKSVASLGIESGSVELLIRNYDLQVQTCGDPSLRLSKHAATRIRQFLDRTRLTQESWDWLEGHWSSTRYEDSCFFDKLFDHPGFYVGLLSRETFSAWWQALLRTTALSQRTVLQTTAAHFKSRGRITEPAFRGLVERAAFLHNLLDILVRCGAIGETESSRTVQSFSTGLDSGLHAELSSVLGESLPDAAPADADMVAWAEATCSFVRRSALWNSRRPIRARGWRCACRALLPLRSAAAAFLTQPIQTGRPSRFARATSSRQLPTDVGAPPQRHRHRCDDHVQDGDGPGHHHASPPPARLPVRTGRHIGIEADLPF
jgi:hypothetical protein